MDGSRFCIVYEVEALPVSATRTVSSVWVAVARDNILYPVMESSFGSSHVRVTVLDVDVALGFAGAAGGLLVDTVTGVEGADSPWSFIATIRNA